MISAAELVQTNLWAARRRKGGYAKKLFDKNAATDENAKEELAECEKYKDRKLEYISEHLGLKPHESYNTDRLHGCFDGIQAALHNRIAKTETAERALVRAFNKIKHAFPLVNITDKDGTEKIGIFFKPDDSELRNLSFSVDYAKQQAGTVEAMTQALEALINLVLDEMKPERTKAHADS